MELSVVVPVLQWTGGFHALYWVARAASRSSDTYRKLDEPEKGYWAASLVSNAHAAIVVWLAAKALNQNRAFFTTTDFMLSTGASMRCCRCFLGYILSDLGLAVWYRNQWSGYVENLVHHVLIVFCWSNLISDQCGQLFGLVGALCEASTPFVNGRWFLEKAGMKKSSLYLGNGLAMAASFFVLRVVGFLWMGTRLVAQRKGLLGLPFYKSGMLITAYSMGTVLQLFWFYKIARGAAKALGLTGTGKSPDPPQVEVPMGHSTYGSVTV